MPDTQLDRLKRRIPTETNQSLLQDMLDDAQAFILSYTGQAVLPAGLLSAQLKIAAANYNELGLEGLSAQSEGGVSVSIDKLPPALQAELNRYRLAKVGW
jgi:hypothetical protein